MMQAMSDETCWLCGKDPADGMAYINEWRLCHGDGPGETCYERAGRLLPAKGKALNDAVRVTADAIMAEFQPIVDAAQRILDRLTRRALPQTRRKPPPGEGRRLGTHLGSAILGSPAGPLVTVCQQSGGA